MSPQPLHIDKVRAPKTLVDLADTGSLELVKIDDLKFDHTYQRDLSAEVVQRMSSEWDPRVAGTIVVNRRPNGDLNVIDGQHRTAAAKTAGEDYILALVFTGLERPSEAGMRVKGNFRRADSPHEKFRARLAAGDKDAKAIKEICDQFNTRINPTPQMKKGINAVAAIEAIYRKDEGVRLTRVFEIIRRAWGSVEGDRVSVATLKGLDWLLETNAEGLDTGHLVDRMQAEGTQGLMRKAYSYQAAHQGSMWVNWYRGLIEAYNTGLPERKRLEWKTGGRGGVGTIRPRTEDAAA